MTTLCVIEGLLIDETPEGIKEFETEMKDMFDIGVKFCEVVTTLPSRDGPGGRKDVFFTVSNDDIMKFAIPRFKIGARWYDDVISNMKQSNRILYPKDILRKYKQYE